MNWKKPEKIALHWDYNRINDLVTCTLCPNICKLKENQTGTCGVRKRVNDQLYTLNYGYCICPVIETIETEAVFHFQPGARILSMGNIGCNMKCSFCQNWETSQIQHLDDRQVQFMTPDDTIKLAEANNIGIISWTYNDPVVWHEYVLETSRLAREHGILTLYKSALNINKEAVSELIDCIDIFSISLKAMDAGVYKRVMKGSLEAVLEGIKQIHDSGKHLEVSQLIVTKLNDKEEQAYTTAKWIKQNLGNSVPLHFVSYHPAYQYNEERSTFQTIEKMCFKAKEIGIKHCYAGNIFGEDLSNTFCSACNHLLVERTGLSITIKGLDDNMHCKKCGQISPISKALNINHKGYHPDEFEPHQKISRDWGTDNSFHLIIMEDYMDEITVRIERLPKSELEFVRMKRGLGRILISRNSIDEHKIVVSLDSKIKAILVPLLDRAHFPTIK
jgi:pyruvate formate lyase activating enzyme